MDQFLPIEPKFSFIALQNNFVYIWGTSYGASQAYTQNSTVCSSDVTDADGLTRYCTVETDPKTVAHALKNILFKLHIHTVSTL